MIILIIILIAPIISYSKYTQIVLENPVIFTFAIINRTSAQHIVYGKDKHDKIIPINTSILELYFGTPNAFFYSGFRASTPLIFSSQTDQNQNNSLKKMNTFSAGLSIGGGYGILFQNAVATHHLKFIVNISVDIGILNPYSSMPESIYERLISGTELLFRYHYTFSKRYSLILGFDTGISIHSQYDEAKNVDMLNGISIFYGGSIGLGF